MSIKYTCQRNIKLVKKTYKNKGIIFLIKKILKLLPKKILRLIIYNKVIFLKPINSSFKFNGNKYDYYYKQWDNERAVEIPIICEILKSNKEKRILEIGNVFSNILPVNHDVLDKYDNKPGLINEDVIDFKPNVKYELIISISTLEHVGWDENPKEPEKLIKAIENLKKCLHEGGKLIFTVPLGYNPYLDKQLKEGNIHFTQKFFLKRISNNNQWIETNWKEVKNIEYNKPFPFANAILIGIITK